MATFGEDGKTDDQLEPPDDLTVPSTDESETLSDTEREADRQATQSRVDADLPAQPGDAEKLDPSVEITGTAVALSQRLDVSTLDEKWAHDWLEFKGDKLGIRLPTRQALAAFSLASSKYVDMGVKNDLTGLFIARHLSPESYGRVFSRLMDPDEDAYTVETIGELFNAIVTASLQDDTE